jgi:hypothetical protein
VRCGRLAVGVCERDLVMEFRRWLNGESESGGWWAVGWERLVRKSTMGIRPLS